MGKITILPRDRLAWHRQMAEDRDLSHVAFRVAVVIGNYFNNNTGRTFVGYETIGDVVGMCRRSVFAAVQELAKRGHLKVVAGGGRKRANEYGMVLKTVQSAAPFGGAETVQNSAQNGAARCTPTLKSSPSEKITLSRARANSPTSGCVARPQEATERVSADAMELEPGSPDFRLLQSFFEASGSRYRAGVMRTCELEGRAYMAHRTWLVDARRAGLQVARPGGMGRLAARLLAENDDEQGGAAS